MKLTIKAYSQRDPRWASDLLGFNTSTYTIGSHGCLITCYAMYLSSIGREKTPKDVDDELTSGNGYVAGSGLLIWSAIPRIYELQEVYVSPKYTGPVTTYGLNKMRELLDQNRPLICHVDFDPRDPDDDMHWVLVHGYDGEDFYCVDPWTGQYISLDVYGGAQRAVIEFRAYDKTISSTTPSTCEAELTKCRLSRDSHWNDLMTIKDALLVTGDYSLSNIIIRIDASNEQGIQLGEKDKQLRQAQDDIQKLREDLQKEQENNKTLQETLKNTKEELEDAEVSLKISKAQMDAFEERIKQLEKNTQTIPKESSKLFWLWIDSLFRR